MRVLLAVACFLFIFLNILPGSFVKDLVDLEHFFSSLHIFEYASLHHFQFGTDIIDGAGPYGYLHYASVYTGGAFWAKILWSASISLVYSIFATTLVLQAPNWPRKFLFLFSVCFFPLQIDCPFFSFEIIPRLAILFSAFFLLGTQPAKPIWRERIVVSLVGLFYAMLTLEKASNAYFLLLVILILSAHFTTTGRWKNALLLSGSYLVGVLALWLHAGQHLSNLPNYFRSMSQFIEAYQETLNNTAASPRDLHFGLFFAGVSLILILARIRAAIQTPRASKPDFAEILRALLIAAFLFLVWKHGLLRSTDSYGIFIFTVPVVLSYLCLFPLQSALPRRSSVVGLVGWGVLLAIVFFNIDGRKALGWRGGIFQEFEGRLNALKEYRPGTVLQDLSAQYRRLQEENELPSLARTSIGFGSVDEFGSSPELILLNDLRYRPRPVPIDFVVATPALNAKNARAYQNPETAPDFIFFRHPGFRLADTSAYLRLIFNYRLFQRFGKWLILKKNPEWRKTELVPISVNRDRFDHWIDLPDAATRLIWEKIDVSQTRMERLKKFLYKPDLIQLDLKLEDDSIRSFPVSVSALRSGFLLTPIARTEESLRWHPHLDPWESIRAFRIHSDTIGLFEEDFALATFWVEPSWKDLPEIASLIHPPKPQLPTLQATGFPVDFLGGRDRDDIHVEGMSGLDTNGGRSWGWGTGSATRLEVFSASDKRLKLAYSFKNPFPTSLQTLIMINGRVIKTVRLSPGEQVEDRLPFNLRPGINTVLFNYSEWNHRTSGTPALLNDPRPLAVPFAHLTIE